MVRATTSYNRLRVGLNSGVFVVVVLLVFFVVVLFCFVLFWGFCFVLFWVNIFTYVQR